MKNMILVILQMLFCVRCFAQTNIALPSECGKSIGCFSLPFDCTTSCHSVYTYLYNPSTQLVTFTVKSTRDWSGLAFNTARQMVGFRGVMCVNTNGNVQLTSRKASAKRLPDVPSSGPDPVSGVTLVAAKAENGITTCEYSATLTVQNASQDFMYDLNTNRYAVYAAGAVVNNLPAYHTFGDSNRVVSSSVVNVRQIQVAPDPCMSFPCSNGATCNAMGNNFNCTCITGFTGDTCQTSPCSPNRCANGGTCSIDGDKITGYSCSCLNGFSGILCQTSLCSPNPCRHGGTCSIEASEEIGYKCSCLNGFSGETCQNSSCSPNPCLNDGECSIDASETFSYTCTCPEQFAGDRCQMLLTTTTTKTTSTKPTTTPSPPPPTTTNPTTTSTSPPPPTTTPTITNPTTTPAPPTTTTTTTTQAAFNTREYCSGRDFGYYPFPDNNNKFIVCFNGDGWAFFCYQGLHWMVLDSSSSGYCGYAAS